MIKFIDSGSVTCEHKFIAICAKILDKHRLRTEYAFPDIGVSLVIKLVYTIAVFRNCGGIDIFSNPCSFYELQRVRSIEFFDFFPSMRGSASSLSTRGCDTICTRADSPS